jgi:hypothetical protein
LKDRKNNEWGYVTSKFWDWSGNPFGYPGARLYLKRDGANQRGLEPGNKGQAWKDQFLNVWGANEVLLAESKMNFMQDNSEIKDCKGGNVITTDNNQIFDAHKAKAGYYLTSSDIERNQAIMYDLSMPPQALVRMEQSEPCSPFPPFCSRLDAFRLFPAGKWDGEIVQKGYGQTLGTVVSVTMAANGASDMRFLALYGVHLFAPTRFSPLVNWILFGLLVSCCCCGCTCTYKCLCGTGPVFPLFGERTTKATEVIMVVEKPPPPCQSSMNTKTGEMLYSTPWTQFLRAPAPEYNVEKQPLVSTKVQPQASFMSSYIMAQE